VEKLDRLIRILRTGGLRRGVELQRELGISQPGMSRLMRQAGPRVGRFGRSVSTCYGLTHEIPGLGRQVPVFRVDERGHPNRHGVLHFLAGGTYWFERESGSHQSFNGLPPFVEDMRPQGYLGRGFPMHHRELGLPGRIVDWSDDHQLIAISKRGEDCVGNLLVGEESLYRLIGGTITSYTRADYPALATGALAGQPGSSAGGEHPKFAVYAGGHHLLVKFAGGDGAAADRWRDLLLCEHLALEMLRAIDIPAPKSDWFDLGGIRFLEVERFDRIGLKGRRGVISLFAVNNHFLGDNLDHWSRAGQRILDEPSLSMTLADADRLVWLDTFGDLIGNTDRHFGNLAFLAEEAREMELSLAPVYDMLPMLFAPTGANLIERKFSPRPPNALNLHLWNEIAEHALKYWSLISEQKALSRGFRHLSTECLKTLEQLVGQGF